MYFEVWIDLSKKEEVVKRLKEVCEEVHEVFYDYQFIVRVKDEKMLEMDGVLRYRRHYNC
jgi:hypothetical protein